MLKQIGTVIKTIRLPMLVLIAWVYASADNVAPSQSPPASLTPDQVPQFVVFGIDDNKFQDGVEWAADYLRNRVNPKGTGNPATFDSTPVRASFYLLSLPAIKNKYLQRALYNLYLDGNEFGNHTLNHLDGFAKKFTDSLWKAEMVPCQNFLTDTLKIPAGDIWGFRTPFLAYNNNGFSAVQQMGFVYDCSIEEGEDSTLDGKNYFWPYTLDSGSPGANVCAALGTHPPVDSSHDGLWEIPVYLVIAPPDSECAEYNIPAGLRKRLFNNHVALTGDTTWDTISGKITGLDYNFWFDFNMTKEDYVAILSYSLDLRLTGNRAPFIFGAHSDFYSLQYISEPLGCNTNYIQRRQAMEEFMDFALSKPQVRVVPAREVIRWMRHPVALGQDFTGPCTLRVVVVDSGAVSVTPQKDSYIKDEPVTLTATPSTGWVFERWAGPDITGDKATLILRMYKNIAAKAIFRKEETALDTTNASANLMSEATWAPECDEIGSKVVAQSFSGDILSVTFWQRPQPNDTTWPWISLSAGFSDNFSTVIGIEVEYQCDNPLIVQFIQPELNNDLMGYAHYQYVGAKSETEWKKIKVPVTLFYQPDWTSLAAKTSLKLNTVRDVGFIPAVGEAGDTTTVKIRKLVLYYSSTPIINDHKIKKSPALSLYSIKPGQLILSVPEAGKYTVTFYSLKGSKIVSLKDIICQKGINRIHLDKQSLAAGVYITRINNNFLKRASGKMLVRK